MRMTARNDFLSAVYALRHSCRRHVSDLLAIVSSRLAGLHRVEFS
jgi:hypothetical protein